LHAKYICQFGRANSHGVKSLTDAMADTLSNPRQALHQRDAALGLMQAGSGDSAQRISK